MNTPQDNLLDSYRLWSKWTEAESTAIHNDDWPQVEECQREKALLQGRILREEERLEPVALSSLRDQVGPVVEKLVRQEQLNQDLLRRKRSHAEQQRTQAQVAGRTLRRVHGAYVPSRSAGWNSYS